MQRLMPSRKFSRPDQALVRYPSVSPWILGLALALGFAFLAWAVIGVPISNDEANHYYPLACWSQPFQVENVTSIRGCDGRYDLTTPLGFVIPHALPYAGVTSSLLYWPFYQAMRDPLSLYAMGVVFLALFVFLMMRLSRQPILALTLLIGFMPLALSFVHDMGPQKITMLLYPLGALLLPHLLQSRTAPALAACIGGLALLIWLAFEEKPYILILLPGMVLFWLAMLDRAPQAPLQLLRQSGWKLGLGLALAAGGIVLLLAGTFADGRSYFATLQDLSQGVGLPAPIYAEAKAPFYDKLFWFLLYAPKYAHRFLDVSLTDAAGQVLVPLWLFLGQVMLGAGALSAFFGLRLWQLWRRQERPSWREFWLMMSFLSTAGAILLQGNSYAGHHFIFMWVPLLMLLAEIAAKLPKHWQNSAIALFLAVNFASLIIASRAEPYHETSRERASISAFFTDERAEDAVVVYLSWGHNLVQTLYGPSQQIIMSVAGPDDLRHAIDVAKKFHRHLYLVCAMPEPDAILERLGHRCEQTRLQRLFDKFAGGYQVTPELPSQTIWQIYRVALDGQRD